MKSVHRESSAKWSNDDSTLVLTLLWLGGLTVALLPWAFAVAAEGRGAFVMLRSLLLNAIGLIGLALGWGMLRNALRTKGHVRWFVVLHALGVAGVVIGSVAGGVRWGWEVELFGLGFFGWGLLTVMSMAVLGALMGVGVQAGGGAVLLRVLLVAAALQAVMGLIQHVFQVDPLRMLHGGSAATLVHGSLGRNDFLALFLLPNLVFLLGSVASKRVGSRWWVWLALVTFALGMNVTDNRAALVGVISAGVMLVMVFRWRAVLPWLLVLACCIAPIPTVAGGGVAGVPGDARTLLTRLGLWRATVSTIPELPSWGLLGLGAHGYRVMETAFMDPNVVLPTYLLEYDLPVAEPRVTRIEESGRELAVWHVEDAVTGQVTTFEQGFLYAHGVLLDVFLQGGVLGLFAWVGLVVGAFALAYKRGAYALAAAVFASGVAYLVWFPNIMTDLQHYAWVALAWFSGKSSKEDQAPHAV